MDNWIDKQPLAENKENKKDGMEWKIRNERSGHNRQQFFVNDCIALSKTYINLLVRWRSRALAASINRRHRRYRFDLCLFASLFLVTSVDVSHRWLGIGKRQQWWPAAAMNAMSVVNLNSKWLCHVIWVGIFPNNNNKIHSGWIARIPMLSDSFFIFLALNSV